jgi:hypothetical protein
MQLISNALLFCRTIIAIIAIIIAIITIRESIDEEWSPVWRRPQQKHSACLASILWWSKRRPG